MEPSPWPNEGSDDASSPAAYQQPSHLSLSGDVTSFDGGSPQQMPTMLYVQPPSGAAKIMGILIVIYGAFGLLASVGGMLAQVFLRACSLMCQRVNLTSIRIGWPVICSSAASWAS